MYMNDMNNNHNVNEYDGNTNPSNPNYYNQPNSYNNLDSNRYNNYPEPPILKKEDSNRQSDYPSINNYNTVDVVRNEPNLNTNYQSNNTNYPSISQNSGQQQTPTNGSNYYVRIMF